ncbi:hypothetical protein PtA15_7A637 [Puccinia triticina]|uniref:Secreted protein n=1 Tax=Puccinia triticina TaxID=208348 RepID=A0ABY7CRF2_9BASI|nr:uncharacterized protein PtA15_7A637 [Puccinia triticina]WAQ86908.1 hypothetical protein PtA15_7A637 [Puccinia triticina]WAR56777.1 hypothetical protein PtB15_7B627 [Puccinia triticina]
MWTMNRRYLFILCGTFLASNAMHDFFSTSHLASQKIQERPSDGSPCTTLSLAFPSARAPEFSGEMRQTLDLFGPPTPLCHGDIMTSEEQTTAGQELRLASIGASKNSRSIKPSPINSEQTPHHRGLIRQ